MSPELLNILSSKELPVSNEELIAYLSGKLSSEQNHAIESALAAGGSFGEDGLEGLLLLENKTAIAGLHHGMVKNLHDTIHSKKRNILKRKTMPLSWLLLLLAGLLVLSLVGWFLIWMLNNS